MQQLPATFSSTIIFDEADYRDLRTRYLQPIVQINAELAMGMRLRRKRSKAVVDLFPNYRPLKKHIQRLERKHDHKGIYELLYKLRAFDLRRGCFPSLEIKKEGEVIEIVDFTSQPSEIVDVEDFVLDFHILAKDSAKKSAYEWAVPERVKSNSALAHQIPDDPPGKPSSEEKGQAKESTSSVGSEDTGGMTLPSDRTKAKSIVSTENSTGTSSIPTNTLPSAFEWITNGEVVQVQYGKGTYSANLRSKPFLDSEQNQWMTSVVWDWGRQIEDVLCSQCIRIMDDCDNNKERRWTRRSRLHGSGLLASKANVKSKKNRKLLPTLLKCSLEHRPEINDTNNEANDDSINNVEPLQEKASIVGLSKPSMEVIEALLSLNGHVSKKLPQSWTDYVGNPAKQVLMPLERYCTNMTVHVGPLLETSNAT